VGPCSTVHTIFYWSASQLTQHIAKWAITDHRQMWGNFEFSELFKSWSYWVLILTFLFRGVRFWPLTMGFTSYIIFRKCLWDQRFWWCWFLGLLSSGMWPRTVWYLFEKQQGVMSDKNMICFSGTALEMAAVCFYQTAQRFVPEVNVCTFSSNSKKSDFNLKYTKLGTHVLVCFLPYQWHFGPDSPLRAPSFCL
jgi:hypothetical protein